MYTEVCKPPWRLTTEPRPRRATKVQQQRHRVHGPIPNKLNIIKYIHKFLLQKLAKASTKSQPKPWCRYCISPLNVAQLPNLYPQRSGRNMRGGSFNYVLLSVYLNSEFGSQLWTSLTSKYVKIILHIWLWLVALIFFFFLKQPVLFY